MTCPTDPAPPYVPPKKRARIAARAAMEIVKRSQDCIALGDIESAVFGLTGALKQAIEALEMLIDEMPPDPPEMSESEL